MIVRETEAEARAAADRLLSKLDIDTGEQIRNKSLDTQSAGVSRQNELATALTTTATPRPIFGPALVGPVPAPARRSSATPIRSWPS